MHDVNVCFLFHGSIYTVATKVFYSPRTSLGLLLSTSGECTGHFVLSVRTHTVKKNRQGQLKLMMKGYL